MLDFTGDEHTDNGVYLVKTLRKKHLEDTIKQGQFCFCHPQVFSGWEDKESAQFDRWEGHSAYEVCHIVYAPIVSEKDGKIVYDHGDKLADQGIVRLQTDVAKETPICCFRMIMPAELDCVEGKYVYTLGETVDRIKQEFQHDAFVMIRLKPFLERLGKHVDWFYARNVICHDLLNDFQEELDERYKEINEQLFRKDERFAWQQEFRIILRPDKEEKKIVSVGSIEDIAYYGDIEELRNGILIAATGK